MASDAFARSRRGRSCQCKGRAIPRETADFRGVFRMFGSTVLEVAIGLVLNYLLFSLACSAAKEGLEALMKKRAIDLERGVRELLDDPDGTAMAARVYKHPLIDGLFKGTFDTEKGGWLWSNLPSYIPAQNFALA